MSDQPRPQTVSPDPAQSPDGKPAAETAINLPPVVGAALPGELSPANTLTPEEQMERFAKELKDNDWGHQPC